MAHRAVFFSFLALCFAFSLASDPMQMQDFCVAAVNSSVVVNGLPCKDSKLVVANDFFFSGLQTPGNTSNRLGFYVTLVLPNRLPGLNTLGVSMARLDFAPHGVETLHYHSRATEMLTVIKGTLEAGFVASNPDGRLFTKVLYPGDIFVFPMGLMHYQRNIGKGRAWAISAFSAQNPGIDYVANLLFGSTPRIRADVIAKAFQIDVPKVQHLETIF